MIGMRKEFIPNIRAGAINPARFWAKVDRSGSGCWPWKAANVAGYGRALVRVMSERGVAWRWEVASRVAYELSVGNLAANENVLHSCDNGLCVRPDHLSKGTQQDNANGMVDRGRFMATLNHALVRSIRERYASEPQTTIIDLATEHGVSYQTIWKIITGKTWRRSGGPIGGKFKRWGDNPSRSPWIRRFTDGRTREYEFRARHAKLTEQDVRVIRAAALKGVTLRELSARYGLHLRSIWAVTSRRTWKHIE